MPPPSASSVMSSPTRTTSRRWLPAPLQSPLISCTRNLRPRFARRSPLICFLAAAVHVQAFPDGLSAAPLTGYDGPNSSPEVFIASGAASALVAAGSSAQSPGFLHADFAAAIRAAQVLHELDATPLGGHFGRPLGGHFCLLSPRGESLGTAFACQARLRRRCCMSCLPLRWLGTLAVTRRSPWRAARRGGPACRPRSPVGKFVPTCPTCERVKADACCRACCTLSPSPRVARLPPPRPPAQRVQARTRALSWGA